MTGAGPFEGLTWPRSTGRLVLRPATAADVDAVWAYRRLPEVNHWLTVAPDGSEAFAEYFARPDRLGVSLLVGLRESPDEVIGDLMLRIGDAWAQGEVKEQGRRTQAELGWSFAPTAGGRGYATEAVGELVRICFEDLGLRRVEAACFADNEPSWRLMERLGMRREALNVRESLHRSLGWCDGLLYALLADEWQGRHGGR